jgi:hypothetical protein
MKISQKIGLVLCVVLSSSFQCQAASLCKNGDLESFKQTWKAFREESVNGSPEKIVDFYTFPLTLTEGTEFGVEFPIPHDSFLKNYDLIFRQQLKGYVGNTALVDALKSASDIGKMYEFDANGCSYSGKTGWYGYEFKWSDSGRWQVYSVERKELKLLKKKMK